MFITYTLQSLVLYTPKQIRHFILIIVISCSVKFHSMVHSGADPDDS